MRRIVFIGVAAIGLLVAGFGTWDGYRVAWAAPGTDDFASRLAAAPFNPIDKQMRPAQKMTCAPGNGMIRLRCVASFVDAARFNRPAYVVVYLMASGAGLNVIKQAVEAKLRNLPGEQPLTVSTEFDGDRNGKKVMTIPVFCEQGRAYDVDSFAVCLAPGAGNTVVTSAVYPDVWSNKVLLSDPPDIHRAMDLEGMALGAVYAAASANTH